MPLFAIPKVLLVIAKDARKTVASYITKAAIKNVHCRKVIVHLGQWKNVVITRSKMEKMGLGKSVRITPLNEQRAIEQGAEIFQNTVEITSHENALRKENALLKQISDLKDELDLCKVRDREQIYKIKQLDEKINRIIYNLRSKVLSSPMKVADGEDSSNSLPVNSSKKRTVILERSGVIGVEYRFDNEPLPLKSPSHNYYSSSIPNEDVSSPRDLIGRSARNVALHLFSKPDESNFSTILPLLLFTSVLIVYLCD